MPSYHHQHSNLPLETKYCNCILQACCHTSACIMPSYHHQQNMIRLATSHHTTVGIMPSYHHQHSIIPLEQYCIPLQTCCHTTAGIISSCNHQHGIIPLEPEHHTTNNMRSHVKPALAVTRLRILGMDHLKSLSL